jgi:hypothetical protein
MTRGPEQDTDDPEVLSAHRFDALAHPVLDLDPATG